MSKKPLSKAELKARKAEKNKTKHKKIDYRAWANKHFKIPTDHLPLKISGIGKGKVYYCPKCKTSTGKYIVKADGKIYCNRCNTEVEIKERK